MWYWFAPPGSWTEAGDLNPMWATDRGRGEGQRWALTRRCAIHKSHFSKPGALNQGSPTLVPMWTYPILATASKTQGHRVTGQGLLRDHVMSPCSSVIGSDLQPGQEGMQVIKHHNWLLSPKTAILTPVLAMSSIHAIGSLMGQIEGDILGLCSADPICPAWTPFPPPTPTLGQDTPWS